MGLLQATLQILHVGILITIALGLAKAHAVDDAGMVQGIRDDGVLVGKERTKQASVGIEASGIKDSVLCLEVIADGSLQLLVNIHGTTDEANGCHTITATVHHVLGSLNQARVVGQAEVVVSTKIEYFLALYLDGCTLGALNDTLFFVKACSLQACESLLKMLFHFSVHSSFN